MKSIRRASSVAVSPSLASAGVVRSPLIGQRSSTMSSDGAPWLLSSFTILADFSITAISPIRGARRECRESTAGRSNGPCSVGSQSLVVPTPQEILVCCPSYPASRPHEAGLRAHPRQAAQHWATFICPLGRRQRPARFRFRAERCGRRSHRAPCGSTCVLGSCRC